MSDSPSSSSTLTSAEPLRWRLGGKVSGTCVDTYAGPQVRGSVEVMPVSEHEAMLNSSVSIEDYTRTAAEWSQRCAEETRKAARLREALESIAETPPGIQFVDGNPQPWTHWAEQARNALAPATPTEGTTMTTYVGLVQRGEILQQRIVAEGNDRAAVEKTAQTRAAELNAGQEPDGFELAWKAATLPRKS